MYILFGKLAAIERVSALIFKHRVSPVPNVGPVMLSMTINVKDVTTPMSIGININRIKCQCFQYKRMGIMLYLRQVFLHVRHYESLHTEVKCLHAPADPHRHIDFAYFSFGYYCFRR